MASSTAAVQVLDEPGKKKSAKGHDYKGFVAGVFSGVAKLTGRFSLHQATPHARD